MSTGNSGGSGGRPCCGGFGTGVGAQANGSTRRGSRLAPARGPQLDGGAGRRGSHDE